MEGDELPQFKGKVEVDETYVGGKYDQRRKHQPYQKQGVMSIVACGGFRFTLAVC